MGRSRQCPSTGLPVDARLIRMHENLALGLQVRKSFGAGKLEQLFIPHCTEGNGTTG